MTGSVKISYLIIFIFGVCFILNSCTHSPWVMPVGERTADPTICFERDVLPIFVSKCTNKGCHDAASHKGGYKLDSYVDIMKKGIVPGNTAASTIWEAIAIKTFNVSKMPIGGSGLTASDFDLIGRWIKAGAVDSGVACSLSTCDSANFTYAADIEPIMQTYCVGCHSSASSTGGSLADYNSVKNAAVNGRLIGNIRHETGYNPMPSAGFSLSECQIAQIQNWVAAGALDN